MKKIFTLITGLILSLAVMAADHYPDLLIRNRGNFKIVIDGHSFFANNGIMRINNVPRGNHDIQIFEVRGSYFGQRERMVNSTSFRMGKQDMRIDINNTGNIDVRRDFDNNEGGYNNGDYGYNNHDNGYNNRDNNWGRSDRVYDWNNNGRSDQRNDERRYSNETDQQYGNRDDRDHDNCDDHYSKKDDRVYNKRDDQYSKKDNRSKDDQRRY